MDISVSRLNNRLALQLPAELPLGLVFVVGEVDNLVADSDDSLQEHNGRPQAHFDLVETNYRLRCRLTPRAAPVGELRQGDTVRVGGHLIFDPHRADYFLVVRDVEVIGEPAAGDSAVMVGEERAALASALADVKKRAEAAQLAPAELPAWVQKMAPAAASAADAPDERAEAPLSSELVDFAVAAIESEEEVELKPEIIEKLAPAALSTPRVTPAALETAAGAAVEPPLSPTYVPPPRRHETDWLVILLILSLTILTVAVIVTSILVLLR